MMSAPIDSTQPRASGSASYYFSAITIAASADAVWAVLTDASRYLEWNTTVSRFDGTIAVGESVTLVATISPERPFKLTVKELVPNARMVWKGGMPLGLFSGERVFTIEPLLDGGVRFAMEEHFRGLLAPLILRAMPNLQPAFDELATALKRRVEGHR